MADYSICLPLALGEQLYARATLDTQRDRLARVRVTLNWQQLEMRDHGYRDFGSQFAQLLFTSPPYEFVADGRFPYKTYCDLYQEGMPPQLPYFSELLCIPDAPIPDTPYLTLNTKVRFWGRPAFDFIREPFFSVLRQLSGRYPILLLGERKLARIGEYTHWGPDAIYSIYEDVIAEQIPVLDRTFGAYDTAGFGLSRLRRDCSLMHHAVLNINFGIGGNTSLAIATGNTLALHCCSGFECITSVLALARTDQAFVTGNWREFIERLEAIP